ncbi:MAG: sensor histidine kinase [Chloroflexi bacterium]|nr:sensor histidine kinase [Chloroflexota bacterium]
MSSDFWDEAIIAIFFLYGLAFYSLGLALLVESGRASELGFAHSMRLLAGFGLLHGTHEWIDMAERVSVELHHKPLPDWLLWLRLVILVTSFLALLAFGEHLLIRERTGNAPTWRLTVLAVGWYTASCIIVRVVFNLNDQEWLRTADVLSRYVLGIPGAMFAAWALLHQRKPFRERGMGKFVRDLNLAAFALALYGGVGQIFPAKSEIFPANTINSEFFSDTFGFPVQLFRAVMGVIVAVAMMQVLRALEFENQQRLATIENEKIENERLSREALARLNAELQKANEETSRLLKEVQQRDAVRGELLHHITAAQESERKRIARELHDETGQALTGLALGLKGLVSMVDSKPDLAKRRLTDMGSMASTALGELRHLINDLRPPQLDDMGLTAALRWMVERANERGLFQTELKISGEAISLPSEVETTLFRIGQEALTNVFKHAHANHVTVSLDYADGPSLTVCDDGVGFDPSAMLDTSNLRTSWGLIGMQERVNLINASLEIESEPNHGSRLTVRLNH